MNVTIISRKFVKPSIPTHLNLSSYKISAIDELVPPFNVRIVLFYKTSNKNGTDMEKSLGKTLSQFNVLAGRYMKDSGSINCNDEGVEYVEAKVDSHLSKLLSQGTEIKLEILNNFVATGTVAKEDLTEALVSIQVTKFECGGLAVGFGMSHRVGDGATRTMFLKSWTAQHRGETFPVSSRFGSATYFPGRNIPSKVGAKPRPRHPMRGTVIGKRFLFSGNSVLALKEKTSGHSSRVQLIISLIWKALMNVETIKYGMPRPSYMTLAMNLRDKTIPPIPEYTPGNFIRPVLVRGEANMEFDGLLDRLGHSIKDTAEDCKKMLSDSENGLRGIINSAAERAKISSNTDLSVFSFTSWSRFPFYEMDFGWGKPDWFGVVNAGMKNVISLTDAKEGNGIEAWVNLDEDDMTTFEQDSNIIAFTI